MGQFGTHMQQMKNPLQVGRHHPQGIEEEEKRVLSARDARRLQQPLHVRGRPSVAVWTGIVLVALVVVAVVSVQGLQQRLELIRPVQNHAQGRAEVHRGEPRHPRLRQRWP